MVLNYLAGRITGLQKVASEECRGLDFPHAGWAGLQPWDVSVAGDLERSRGGRQLFPFSR